VGNRQAHHPLIVSPRLYLPDLQYIILSLKQGPAQRSVAALINEETHGTGFSRSFPGNDHGLLMGNRIRRVTNGGLNILGNKLGLCLQKIRFGRFFAKLAQNELNR
jgi:hypothetical protein